MVHVSYATLEHESFNDETKRGTKSESGIRSAIETSQWSISVRVLRLSIIRRALRPEESSTRGNTCLSRFLRSSPSRIRRVGIDRYIFELARVYATDTHAC